MMSVLVSKTESSIWIFCRRFRPYLRALLLVNCIQKLIQGANYQLSLKKYQQETDEAANCSIPLFKTQFETEHGCDQLFEGSIYTEKEFPESIELHSSNNHLSQKGRRDFRTLWLCFKTIFLNQILSATRTHTVKFLQESFLIMLTQHFFSWMPKNKLKRLSMKIGITLSFHGLTSAATANQSIPSNDPNFRCFWI